MNPQVRTRVGQALASSVERARSVSGGSINDAYACELADGRTVFVKSNRSAGTDMFPLEARGLHWLAEASAIRVPQVLAVNQPGDDLAYLVLEYIEPGRRGSRFDEKLGQLLAELHRFGAASFGLDHDNYLATLTQDNSESDDWAEFYCRCRLEPQVRWAVDAGHGPPSWVGAFERLYARMDELVGPVEPPARLHGDLWSGNLHSDRDGQPVLIDPAVYGGHREIDLAMLQLFGSPGPRFFAAYDEAHPRAAGHQDRLALYQLYPLLAHVNLFGSGYVGSVESALGHYV